MEDHVYANDEMMRVPAGQQLALNGQATTRQIFVRKLTDIVVLPVGKVSQNERNFAADILIRTLQNVDRPLKIEVAERLSGITDLPRHLQRWLVLNDIEIAAPMLESGADIHESLLMEAADLGYQHRCRIVRRDDLGGAVADVLVGHNETAILRRLLDRDDVILSDKAIEIMVRMARVEEVLRSPLLHRLELRCDQAFIMYWWLDTQQRKQLLRRFTTDRSVLQEAMHEIFVATFTSEAPDLLVKSNLNLIDRRHRPRGRNGEMVTMDLVERTLTAARCQPTKDYSHAVGLLAGVSQETAELVLYDASGESFAIICKSIGVSRDAFRRIISDNSFADEDSPAILSEEKIDDLVGVFDSIARDFSRTILRYWDWKTDDGLDNDYESQPAPEAASGAYFGAL